MPVMAAVLIVVYPSWHDGPALADSNEAEARASGSLY
jgi:hypothetical protein